MSKTSICLFLAICAFCIKLPADVLVSSSHPYYPLVSQYLLNEESKDAKIEEISKDDKLEDCIRKILIIRRKLACHSKKAEAYQGYLQVYDVYARIVHDAYVKYPNDALLNVLYAKVVQRGKYYYTDEHNRFSDIIYYMLPFIEKNSEMPCVASTMFYFFDFLKANLPYSIFYMRYVKISGNGGYYEKANKDDKDAVLFESSFSRIYNLMGITSNNDENGTLMLLTNYWANKINPADIENPSFRKKVIEAHGFMKSAEKFSKAQKAWLKLMDAVINDHTKATNVHQRIEAAVNVNRLNGSVKPVLAVRPKGLEENLAELEQKHKMDYVEIQSFFGNRLRAFRNKLKDMPDLPNLEKIKEANSATEAVVLNLWYKFAIHEKTREVYDAIGATEDWEQESRLVMLRMICARDLKLPRQELIDLCDALVKLEPKNQMYRHTRLSLDAPQTATGGNAIPQRPDSYLVELQRRRFASSAEALKELETNRKLELVAIEILMGKIGSFRKELKGSPNLPNLEQVKVAHTEPEAAILNLWYKYSVHRSYQEIYEAVGKTAAWEKDGRLVFLRLLCGRRLNIEKTVLLKLCDTLIALEPNNQRFKHLKLTFEMN
ncbi:MAG: hypothetical protein ACI4WT_05745 [Oligosphaeraceae bacterium]